MKGLNTITSNFTSNINNTMVRMSIIPFFHSIIHINNGTIGLKVRSEDNNHNLYGITKVCLDKRIKNSNNIIIQYGILRIVLVGRVRSKSKSIYDMVGKVESVKVKSKFDLITHNTGNNWLNTSTSNQYQCIILQPCGFSMDSARCSRINIKIKYQISYIVLQSNGFSMGIARYNDLIAECDCNLIYSMVRGKGK